MSQVPMLRLIHGHSPLERIASPGTVPEADGRGADVSPAASTASLHDPGATPDVADGSLEDAKLVRRALAGERDAFESLYRRYAAFTINLAVRLQGSASDVEDIAHDAFIRAHSRLGELREPARFRSWIGAIVVRLVRSRLRRERLARVLGLGAHRDSAVNLEAIASNDASPEQRAELAQVYALLSMMPADLRIAWTLRYIERHRLEAIAQLTECSLATAKRRLAKAQRFVEAHFVVHGADATGQESQVHEDGARHESETTASVGP